MVHVCGARFTDRAPGQRNVTVYTNCPEVTLLLNGEVVGTQKAEKHMVVFENVALRDGANTVTAQAAGAPDDTITLNGVATPNPDYKLPDDGSAEAGNWFDDAAGQPVELTFPEGYYSIKDKIGDLMEHPETGAVLGAMMEKMAQGGNGMAKSMKNMMGMIKAMTLENVLKMAGKKVPPSAAAQINEQLTKIKK
jgi:beta-galactosidase